MDADLGVGLLWLATGTGWALSLLDLVTAQLREATR